MHGLTARWNLTDGDPQAQADVAAQLREYVTGPSLERFTGMAGLAYKTWRMREGEWFEGTYVWGSAEDRDVFAKNFAATGADNPGSRIIGAGPALIETFEVVAVAEGAVGFSAGPGPGAA